MRTTHAIKTTKAHAKAEPKSDQALLEPSEEKLAPIWRSLALGQGGIQTKLAISQPSDAYELEADRIADRVMRMPTPLSPDNKVAFSSYIPPHVQRMCSSCEEENESSPSDAAVAVQRKCGPCTEEDEEQKLQRKTDSNSLSSSGAAAIVHHVLSSPGEPLDEATRNFMEPRLGFDLSHVRIHRDSRAAESARAVNALAYTVGNHVAFASNHYVPTTVQGKTLLAHELTHVAQQRGASLQRGFVFNALNAGPTLTPVITLHGQPQVARQVDPAAESLRGREESIRRAIEFIQSMQRLLAGDHTRARMAVTRASGRVEGGRLAHPILNQGVIQTYITRVRSIYDAQRTQLDPNHALLGDLRLAYANFLGAAREAIDYTVEIRSRRLNDPAEEEAYTETLLMWLEASPLRDDRLTGRTTFTAADVSASQRQDPDLASVLPTVISRVLPTLNLLRPAAVARLRAVIEQTRSRITAPVSGPPALTTATGPVLTAADDVLRQINGAEQAIERGRVLLRAAVARLDVWLAAPTMPNDVVTRVDELFHTTDPGYGRLLRDRLQLMLTNLEGSGSLVIRLQTPTSPPACRTPDVLGEKTAPYDFVFCRISPSLDSNAATMLHELAHAVIPGRGSRGSAETGFPVDRAYRGERLMLRMTTEEALNNAESYSQLVLILAGVPVGPARVDTATACADAGPILDALALAESAHRRAWSNLEDVQVAITAGRPALPWIRTLIDTHLSTPADPLLLELLRDFENLFRLGSVWRIGHTVTCATARECPTGAIGFDRARIYRDGSVSARSRRTTSDIHVCPGFFALAAPLRARAAYVMISLGFGERMLTHADRVWDYASLALAIYTSDLGAPPSSSLAEHEAADAAAVAPTAPAPTTPAAPAAPAAPGTTVIP